MCNGYDDCEDSSDEANCTKISICPGFPDCDNSEYIPGRLDCHTHLPSSIPANFIMDGVDDCQNGLDECPTFLDTDVPVFSRKYLIGRAAITLWLWVMTLVGIVGNISVFVYTLRRLLQRGSLSSIARANLLFVLNLSVADFFTALYLLVIGSKNIEYAGTYCFKDLEWRTSNACNVLGSFAIFSTEASLFMLTLMTSQRLYTALDPLTRISVRLRLVVVGIVLAWCIAAVIGILPLFLPHVFVERYWIKSKFFNLPLVQLPAFDRFFRTLIYISEPANTTALKPGFDFRTFLDSHYPQFKILGDFGYYSENPFCVSHFYPTVGDNGWYYPTLTITINLIAFVYVAVAYGYIYKVSSRDIGNSEQDTSSVLILQKRITKLVLVNFFVWFPICTASYVQLGLKMEFSPYVFVFTAVILFPINSVLNPLLYSDAFERMIIKLRNLIKS